MKPLRLTLTPYLLGPPIMAMGLQLAGGGLKRARPLIRVSVR